MKYGLSVIFKTSTVISIQKTLLILFVTNISARETPEQEIYLQPRNYNPHPYQTVHQLPNPEYQLQGSEAEQNYLQPSSAPPLSNIFNQGPVQFPSNNVATAGRKYPHPYASLELKSRNSKLHRFSGQDNELVTPAYQALANHAKKVLSNSDPHANDVNFNDGISSDDKKQYAFSYTVKNSASGDDFSHSQQQNNGAVEGNYNVQLPDGRTQIVKYIADNNGYRADVSYVDEYGHEVNNRGNSIDPISPLRQQSQRPAEHTSPLATAHPSFYKPTQQYKDYEESADYDKHYYFSTRTSPYSSASATEPSYNRLKVNNIKINTYSEPHHDKYHPGQPKVYVSTQGANPTSLTPQFQGFRYTTIAPYNNKVESHFFDDHYDYQLVGTTPAP